MQEGLKSTKKRMNQLNTTDETNQNNSAGRNTRKLTAPFASKCKDRYKMSLVTSELSFSGAAVGRLGLDEVTGSDLYQHCGALSSVSQSEKPNKFLTSLIG